MKFLIVQLKMRTHIYYKDKSFLFKDIVVYSLTHLNLVNPLCIYRIKL
jgi:hypothetical protein